MTKNRYNATNEQVKPVKVDQDYVADLHARMKSARARFRASSSRLEVLSESKRQARAR